MDDPFESDSEPPIQRTSQLCVWSLVLGILSPFCCVCFTGVPAVILGHQGLKQVGDESGEFRGRGQAIAGLVLGYLAIALTLVATVLLVAMGGFEELGEAIEDLGKVLNQEF